MTTKREDILILSGKYRCAYYSFKKKKKEEVKAQSKYQEEKVIKNRGNRSVKH